MVVINRSNPPHPAMMERLGTAARQDATMDNSPTCGKGLAENSLLPGKLGELAAAMAENFEVHMRALEVSDPVSNREYQVYSQLASEQREAASQLLAAANEMAAARELVMGRHDFDAELNAQALQAFEKVVKLKLDVLSLLQHTVERDQQLLMQMRRAQGQQGSRR
jgi:hypothetical protein